MLVSGCGVEWIATGGDDKRILLWDITQFSKGMEKPLMCYDQHEKSIRKLVWHPVHNTVLSGSLSGEIRLWDPRTSDTVWKEETHKEMITILSWQRGNPHLFISGSRDKSLKCKDVRMLSSDLIEFSTKGLGIESKNTGVSSDDSKSSESSSSSSSSMKEWMSKDKSNSDEYHTCLTWHPQIENYFVTGTDEGSIYYWNTQQEQYVADGFSAHQKSISDIVWHPSGHVLSSVSLDATLKIWARPRPDDEMCTCYNIRSLSSKDQEDVLDIIHLKDVSSTYNTSTNLYLHPLENKIQAKKKTFYFDISKHDIIF
jgi:polyadenylation factor subunit 2